MLAIYELISWIFLGPRTMGYQVGMGCPWIYCYYRTLIQHGNEKSTMFRIFPSGYD